MVGPLTLSRSKDHSCSTEKAFDNSTARKCGVDLYEGSSNQWLNICWFWFKEILHFFTNCITYCFIFLPHGTHKAVQIILIFVCLCWCRCWASFTRNCHRMTIIMIFVCAVFDISQNLSFHEQSGIFWQEVQFEWGWSINAIKYSLSVKTTLEATVNTSRWQMPTNGFFNFLLNGQSYIWSP